MRRVTSAADLSVACPLCHATPGRPCGWKGAVYPGVVHRERARMTRGVPITVEVTCCAEHAREADLLDGCVAPSSPMRAADRESADRGTERRVVHNHGPGHICYQNPCPYPPPHRGGSRG